MLTKNYLKKKKFKEKRKTKLIRVGEKTHSALSGLSKEKKQTISKLTDELLLQNIPEVYFVAKALKKNEKRENRKVRKTNQRNYEKQENEWRQGIS